MNISPTLSNVLAGSAAEVSGGQIQTQIAVAVLKQLQEQQAQQSQALLKMIQQPAPTLDGTGTIVNVAA
jgi:hypothetical protein